jgi:hypothetical protein
MKPGSIVLLLFCILINSPSITAATPALVESNPRQGLPNFFRKLNDGKELSVAYFGGSITAQAGWRPKTLRWLREQFTNASIDEINAAIGGTGSDLGVFRFQQDVLTHKPDLVFVEFAVNDAGSAPDQIRRCMEGIVRQGWKADASIDFCFVYTIAGSMLEIYQSGKTPRSVTAMEGIAEHYGIPTINFGLQIARLEKEHKLVFKGERPKTDNEKAALNGRILFSPDGVHPYPEGGHDEYLETVVRSMPAIRAAGSPGPHKVGTPLLADNYENAKLVPLTKVRLSSGWTRLATTNSIAKNFRKQMPEIWKAAQPGDSISFQFKGTSAGIYDLLGPDCGQVTVTLGDQPAVTRPRFDSYSTYHRLGTLRIADNLPDGLHQVKLQIHPDQPDKSKILAQRNEKIDDPKRYDGKVWYAGSIMLIGNLVEDPKQ